VADSSAHHPQKTEKHPRNLFVLEPLGFARGGKGLWYFSVVSLDVDWSRGSAGRLDRSTPCDSGGTWLAPGWE
jgi:hypothetical protein